MSDKATVLYDGVTITYDERADRWVFELRGRERSAESLSKAKEIVDKPAPKNKEAFKRCSAYKVSYSGECELITVTSVAEGTSWSGSDWLWIVDSRKQRQKVRCDDIVLVTPETQEAVKKVTEINTQIETLQESVSEIVRSLPRFKVEKEEAA